MDQTGESIFHLQAPFAPTGDQPQAIEALVQGIRRGTRADAARRDRLGQDLHDGQHHRPLQTAPR